jgi:hypothetical protein
VERARTLDDRLKILASAIQRLGYGSVETHDDFVMPPIDRVARRISNSIVLASNELIVPLRAVGGAALGTLVLREPFDGAPPTADRVRTVELFAQQVASIIENARLYEESERQRGRGEAFSDIARAVSGSLRLGDVLKLSLGHAIALLHAAGAMLSLVRDQQLTIVAGLGAGECLVGAPLPPLSLSWRAIASGGRSSANTRTYLRCTADAHRREFGRADRSSPSAARRAVIQERNPVVSGSRPR